MLKLHENELDIDTYLNLRAAVGWKKLDNKQAIMALKNSIYTLTATIDDKVVGMARMEGEGAVICYIQDLVVHPSYQKLGVGQMLMEKLVGHAEEIKIQGTELMLCLMCAKGREGFYEKFGFIARPTENLGPGMIMYL